MVDDLKEALMEDVDQRREISSLRRQDQKDNYNRETNLRELYKQDLMLKLKDKKDKAERIKEQQKRIANIFGRQMNTSHTTSPTKTIQVRDNLNNSSMF